MNTPSDSTTPGRSVLRTLFNRQTVLSFLAGALLVGSIGAVTAAMGGAGWHHAMMMHGAASPEEMSAHIDHVLKHLYVEIDATDAQKAKIGPLVHQAVTDLLPLHTQLEAAHTQAVQGLTQPTVDRAALESARQAHLQLADQASKRIVQLLGDVGDVLTPAQRTALADHLAQLHGKATGMPHS
ncbi:MAG: periplasmic heavy metal sensor [Steroidobacteraceae bacterium]